MIPEERSTTRKTSIPELARELLHLPLAQVVPSNTNPRLNLDKEPFEQLKKSIHANGLLQPIVVRPKGDVYEIIGGHRRHCAIQELAQEHPSDKRFTRIAVVVVHVPDEVVPLMQLAENVNRSDLSPIEIADGVARAVQSGLDLVRVAQNLGWTRRHVHRYWLLSQAPAWIRDYIKEVKVTREKRDASGAPIVDPETMKPVLETQRYPGLGFTQISDLISLYGILREADALQLEEQGGEGFHPQAERITKRLASACAAEGWSKRRLQDEIARAKDPTPRKQREASVRPALESNEQRVVIDLQRAAELAPAERAELAAQLTTALAVCKIRCSVVVT